VDSSLDSGRHHVGCLCIALVIGMSTPSPAPIIAHSHHTHILSKREACIYESYGMFARLLSETGSIECWTVSAKPLIWSSCLQETHKTNLSPKRNGTYYGTWSSDGPTRVAEINEGRWKDASFLRSRVKGPGDRRRKFAEGEGKHLNIRRPLEGRSMPYVEVSCDDLRERTSVSGDHTHRAYSSVCIRSVADARAWMVRSFQNRRKLSSLDSQQEGI